jgi:ribonuclease HI
MEIVSQTMAWYDDFVSANQRPVTVSVRKDRVQWAAPLSNEWKFNVDGAFLNVSSNGGLGGVIRDSAGMFIVGFAKSVHHVGSAYQVELLGIKEALIFLSSLPRQSTLMVSDCLMAIHAIHAAEMEQSLVTQTLKDIQELLLQLPHVTLSFEPRQTNRVAHSLASHALGSSIDHSWSSNALDFIQDALAYDCNSS